MSDWTKNNQAHKHTWTCLLILRELSDTTTFDIAGDVPMNGLAFWSGVDSADMRATKAKTLATQLDNMFRLLQGAQYELGIDQIVAVGALTAALTNRDKLLKELARVADECYRFRNEVTA